MLQPFVITVILNTNRCVDTLEALASIENSTYENHSVLVLDNASSDGSVEAIQKEFPDVEIIELARKSRDTRETIMSVSRLLSSKERIGFLC